MHTFVAFIPDFIQKNLGWWLFGIILLAGIVLGFTDLLRLSWRRIWAIAGVCMIEARRRRVFWIVPLAFLGVVVVSQLQRPLDEQDAIRQTTKFCIFATGFVVAVTTIILACTNLPREIENRVIYSVVTKPTTRLEVVLGKVIGFARVSFWILLIMGLLSWGYLAARAQVMERHIAQRLEAGTVAATSVATLTYYRDAGLLGAKKLEQPAAIDVYSRVPQQGESRRYFYGGGNGAVLTAFDIDPQDITPQGGTPGEEPLLVRVWLGYERTERKPDAASASEDASPTTLPATRPGTKPWYGPFLISPEERAEIMAGTHTSQPPTISIDVLDSFENHLGMVEPMIVGQRQFELTRRDGLTEVHGFIPPGIAKDLRGRIYIRVTGMAPDTEYYSEVGRMPVPVSLVTKRSQTEVAEIPPATGPDDKPIGPIFQGRSGNFGQQLRGGDEAPTGVFQFRGVDYALKDGLVPFELRSGIERSGAEDDSPVDSDAPTQVSVRVHNLAGGVMSDEVILQPESNRTVFFRVKPEAVEGGNFNVLVRTLTRGDHLGIKPASLVLISASQPFAWNLAKSLFILWLLTVLITAVAIFTSTFLSWPIAVVLTLVILLGHWGVAQLGDSIAPGIGAQVVTDLGLKEAAKAEAVRATVERLSSFLNFISTILPDIARYAAVEDIERGVSIPPEKLRDALMVTFGFALPLVLLAYLFLKNKEVAP